MKYYFPETDNCFVCGKDNIKGLHQYSFFEDGYVKLKFIASNYMSGYTDMMHGGIAATILDEVMTWAAFVYGSEMRLYFTREMRVKYKRAILLNNNTYIAKASYVTTRKRLVFVDSVFIDKDNVIYAKSDASYYPASREMSIEGFKHAYYEKDKAYHPKIYKALKEFNLSIDIH
ncbi:MAG: PaaI family thioesterase [Deferribacterota bacterium]|nr:PaaI family thioesterase [Deferribacterota bacterium]